MVAGSAVCRRTPYCCAVSSHDSLRPPSQSAMMDFALLPIMPDCHGRLFASPWRSPCPPRGDQIPVIEFQTTAPPSRVNFREIRGPGVSTSKMEKSPENRACCGNIAACSRLSRLFFFVFQFPFVQNGSDLSKGSEQRKNFFEFFCFRGFETVGFFAYWWREHKKIPRKGGCGCRA